MPMYRKKPVEIEAVQFTRADDGSSNLSEIIEFLGGDYLGLDTELDWSPKVVIKTLEGRIYASPGDYVIRGVQGEHYPCKPDIFNATYEPVED